MAKNGMAGKFVEKRKNFWFPTFMFRSISSLLVSRLIFPPPLFRSWFREKTKYCSRIRENWSISSWISEFLYMCNLWFLNGKNHISQNLEEHVFLRSIAYRSGSRFEDSASFREISFLGIFFRIEIWIWVFWNSSRSKFRMDSKVFEAPDWLPAKISGWLRSFFNYIYRNFCFRYLKI